jgi:hypothetical protein
MLQKPLLWNSQYFYIVDSDIFLNSIHKTHCWLFITTMVTRKCYNVLLYVNCLCCWGRLQFEGRQYFFLRQEECWVVVFMFSLLQLKQPIRQNYSHGATRIYSKSGTKIASLGNPTVRSNYLYFGFFSAPNLAFRKCGRFHEHESQQKTLRNPLSLSCSHGRWISKKIPPVYVAVWIVTATGRTMWTQTATFNVRPTNTSTSSLRGRAVLTL